MRALAKCYEQAVRLRRAAIPAPACHYVVVLPSGWLEGDPKGARAFDMEVLYSDDIDRPIVGFDPSHTGWSMP